MRSHAEVLGSLALASEMSTRRGRDPIPFHVLDGAGGTGPREISLLEHLRKILPFHHGVRLRLVQSKPSFSAARFAAVILVLLVVITFLLLEFTVHHSGPTFMRASAPPAGGVLESATSAGSESNGLPRLEPSHLHVTDDATLSELQDFSRFELQPIRRQAEFGDGAAALTLGMAYETGEGITQSCAQAARWILISAQDGNPAARYKPALALSTGDDGAPIPNLRASTTHSRGT